MTGEPEVTSRPHGSWWSARYIVAIGLPLRDMLRAHNRPGAGTTGTVLAEVVYDIDPVESGLDEYRWRRPEDREVIGIPVADLLRTVAVQQSPAPQNDKAGSDADADDAVHAEAEAVESAAEDLANTQALDFRTGRDRHRIRLGLPRHVVRSDVYDKAAGGRVPLYALRHAWPAGTFMQGGKASRTVPATAEHLADPDTHTFDKPDGTTEAILHDRVFIEAFPPPTRDNPNGGYMRGTGETFADAEDALWTQWTAKSTCPAVASTGAHRWETRGYKNGAGFCADCDVFGSRVFDVAEVGDPCVVCGTRTWWSHVGIVGGTPDETAAPNRHRHERTVCPDHSPPSTWDVTDVRASTLATLDPVETAWFTRFLPNGLRLTDLGDEDRRVLTDAVEDGRAWLVDEAIAGRMPDAEFARLRAAWDRTPVRP